jgi:hypothetical protein
VHLLEVGYRGCTYGYNKVLEVAPLGLGVHKACVLDLLNHFSVPTLYRYRFITLLAGAQRILAHPVLHKSILET